MRTVIVSKLSGLYFIAFGSWAADPHHATIFPSPKHARDFIAREHLIDVCPMVIADPAALLLSEI